MPDNGMAQNFIFDFEIEINGEKVKAKNFMADVC